MQATEADDPALVPVPPPDLGEGPTSRTVQWFLFSAVAVIGYPLLLQRPREHGMSEVEPATVLAAVVAVAGRTGLARLTVDEVAREAGVGRASVYRWFPGGREQLVDEGITWEVGRFLQRLEDAAAGATDLRDRLIRSITFARRALADHAVLQRLLAAEPGGVLPQLQRDGPPGDRRPARPARRPRRVRRTAVPRSIPPRPPTGWPA